MRTIKHIVIHCSATPNGNDGFKMADLDRMHRDRGWKKIGYHYVIEISGAVVTGRAESEVGAHVEGSNATSIGICLIGTNRFTLAQWIQLAGLVSDLRKRYPAAQVLGHRDFSPDLDGDGEVEPHEWFKTCPGFEVSEWLLSGMLELWNPGHVQPSAAY